MIQPTTATFILFTLAARMHMTAAAKAECPNTDGTKYVSEADFNEGDNNCACTNGDDSDYCRVGQSCDISRTSDKCQWPECPNLVGTEVFPGWFDNKNNDALLPNILCQCGISTAKYGEYCNKNGNPRIFSEKCPSNDGLIYFEGVNDAQKNKNLNIIGGRCQCAGDTCGLGQACTATKTNFDRKQSALTGTGTCSFPECVYGTGEALSVTPCKCHTAPSCGSEIYDTCYEDKIKGSHLNGGCEKIRCPSGDGTVAFEADTTMFPPSESRWYETGVKCYCGQDFSDSAKLCEVGEKCFNSDSDSGGSRCEGGDKIDSDSDESDASFTSINFGAAVIAVVAFVNFGI